MSDEANTLIRASKVNIHGGMIEEFPYNIFWILKYQ